MAANLSEQHNNERFTWYPFDLRKQTSSLQARKLNLLASRCYIGDRVLDVGCNSGHFADFARNCEVHGIDLSPALVEEAKKHLASAQVGCAERLPFPHQSFDVVVLAGVMEYFFDPIVALHEAARVSRRIVIGTAEHEDGIWGRHRVADHPFMVRSYDKVSLYRDLEQIGEVTWFEVLRSNDGVPQHYLWEIAPRG